ncbi:hypothetical protein HGRIS_003121 [Hohenbuehelia grisea]|uniref:PEBP-like protein n=1 Tax=Hohenbuehelia grisea TaxID=104357 RepID=A0ABR3JMH4_9AGAR
MYSIFAAGITLFSIVQRTTAQEVTTDSVSDAFTQARVVPDVLRSFEPQGVLEVVFTDPSTSNQIRVTPGMNLTPAQTANRPNFGVSGLPPSFAPQSFVLAFIDPDAPTPSNRTLAQVRHLLGGDFALEGQLNETTPLLANKSEAITEYLGPGPPPGSGPHRYVVLLFNQNTTPNQTFPSVSASFANSTTPRIGFNVTRFAEETGLTGPVAGTFFFVAPEGASSSSSSSASGASTASTATTPRSVSTTSPSTPTNSLAPATGSNAATSNMGVSLVALMLAVTPLIFL